MIQMNGSRSVTNHARLKSLLVKKRVISNILHSEMKALMNHSNRLISWILPQTLLDYFVFFVFVPQVRKDGDHRSSDGKSFEDENFNISAKKPKSLRWDGNCEIVSFAKNAAAFKASTIICSCRQMALIKIDACDCCPLMSVIFSSQYCTGSLRTSVIPGHFS